MQIQKHLRLQSSLIDELKNLIQNQEASKSAKSFAGPSAADSAARSAAVSSSMASLIEGLEILERKEADELSIVLEADTGRKRIQEPGAIYIKDLEIHLKSHKVLMAGKEVSLTPKEFDILYFLAENQGEVFTKEQIYNAVWSDKYLMDDSNIMAFIRKIRKKIEPQPDAPQYLLTIWGIGYKMNDSFD